MKEKMAQKYFCPSITRGKFERWLIYQYIWALSFSNGERSGVQIQCREKRKERRKKKTYACRANSRFWVGGFASCRGGGSG